MPNASTATHRFLPTLLISFAALACLLAAAFAPEPDAVPRRWEFDIKVGPLRMINANVPGVGQQPYFYLTYKVVNATGQDLLLAPSFDLATGDGDLIRAGRDVPTDVTRQVLDLLSSPFIQDQIGVLGMLLQGEENAKEGVVIWPVPRNQLDGISIYANGFSGETKSVQIPDPASGELKKIALRKTMMVRYATPGELNGRGSTPFEVTEQRWIMR